MWNLLAGKPLSRVILLPGLALGLAVAPMACRHTKPTGDSKHEAPERARSDEAEDGTANRDATPTAADRVEAEMGAITVRLQKLGQEISHIANGVADRMKPDLERLEKKRVSLSEKINREGARVNRRVLKSMESLEDDLRLLRTRITGPEPRSKTPETDPEESSE